MDLDNLIKYEHENTALDFKSIQYEKEHYDAMIKDVMSMANADIDSDRYIITGIKDKPSGERVTLGIEESQFEDSATYQQLILNNIEPQVNIDYFSYTYDDKKLGIIKIYDCNNQPYMMRKDFKNLQRGDSFIRIGSHQTRMVLSDYERIYNKRKPNNDFTDKVKLGFDKHEFAKEIELNYIKVFDHPSERAKKEIEAILIKKKNRARTDILRPESLVLNTFPKTPNITSPFVRRTYGQSSIEELETDLLRVKDTYKDDDYYEYFELHSLKLNISICNQGDSYFVTKGIVILKIVLSKLRLKK